MQSPMRDVQGAWTEIRRFDMIRDGSVVSDCFFCCFWALVLCLFFVVFRSWWGATSHFLVF